MSIESETRERHKGIRARLWGEPVRAQRPVRVRPMEPPEPIAPVMLPMPTKAQMDALLDENDDRGWQEGFTFILKSYGENMRRLVSLQRDQHIIDCRVAVAAYLRARGWSYPRIGQVMKRDHSSIVHLLQPQRKREAYLKKVATRVKRRAARLRAEATNAVT